MKENEYYKKTGLVSNSSLPLLKKSPRLFKKFLNGELEDKEEKYLNFGRLVHMYLLERKLFNANVVVMDYDTPRSAQQKKFCIDYLEFHTDGVKTNSALVKAYKANYKTTEKVDAILIKAKALKKQCSSYFKFLEASATKEVITPKIMENIVEIHDNVKKHKAAGRLLFDDGDFIADDSRITYNEHAIYWNYKEKLKCKSLLDRFIVDKESKTITLIDIKTTNDLSTFDESFDKYNYARQLCFYAYALYYNPKSIGIEEESLTDWNIEFRIVAIDSINFDVKVHRINPNTVFNCGLHKQLDRALWHITNDKWDYSMEYYEGDGIEKL